MVAPEREGETGGDALLVGHRRGKESERAALEAEPQVEGAGAELRFVGFHINNTARREGAGGIEGVVDLAVGEGDVAAVAEHITAEIYLTILAVGDSDAIDGEGAELASQTTG